jgi:hypothetical protein
MRWFAINPASKPAGTSAWAAPRADRLGRERFSCGGGSLAAAVEVRSRDIATLWAADAR